MTGQKHWHAMQVDAVLTALDASRQGLSESEVDGRLEGHGPNTLPAARPQPAWLRFLRQFHNVLIYVLLVAALITLSLDKMIDTAVILGVVFANAAIGYVQEGRAEKAMEAIRKLLALRATVLRAGMPQRIDASGIVPGDIVVLQAGDKVAADLRVVTADSLRTQEAILTGESLPVNKHEEPVSAESTLADRGSMLYAGTLVTAGAGSGVVVATGSQTEAGRISRLISTVEPMATPLVRQMNVFARWLSLLILLIAGVLLVFGYYVAHYPFAEMFMAVVGLSVAAIPEGLPAVFTITLAVGVQSMARRNAIVRRLPAIETLGSVSVICTDKTGTLTRNEMSVVTVATAECSFSVGGTGYEPTGEVVSTGSGDEADPQRLLGEIGLVCVLCNDASLYETDGTWKVAGDPMEGALLAFSRKIGFIAEQDQSAWSRIAAQPFDPRNRFMATLHEDDTQHRLLAVKGAPEQVLSMCNSQRRASHDSDAAYDEPLDTSFWESQAESIATQGQRVIGIAVRTSTPDGDSIELETKAATLTFLGLLGLIDPPRPEAIAAVAECQAAGITVKMITGDHKGTAAAIGRQIGLADHHKVLTGAQIDAMSDERLEAAAMHTGIFARSSPEHKLRLVDALQAQNMTVAMTGDGVNDAPALKKADVGIAMGRSGSEAAKEAAEIVLADDNFASIVAAVREGRTVYDNFKKVIGWTLPTSFGEAVTIIVALLIGMTLPISPVQILWVNLVTVATLGLALAFEPSEGYVMRRPPRPRTEPLLRKYLAWHIVLVSTVFLVGIFGVFAYTTGRGESLELARTMAVNTLVSMEIFQLLFIRNMHVSKPSVRVFLAGKIVWAMILIVVAAQLAITYLPPLQRIFGMESMSLNQGLLVITIGFVSFAISEAAKQLRFSLASQSR